MPISHLFDTDAKTAKARIIHFDVIIDERDQQKALDYAQKCIDELVISLV